MITERIGDLLAEPDLTHVAHQCNLYCTFGAGLALQIKKKWPHAARLDAKTGRGDRKKLGTFQVADGSPAVVNLYTQTDWTTHLPSLRRALTALEEEMYAEQVFGNKVRIGLPYRLGCGLAGGAWPKVYGIIEAVFGQSPVEVVVVRLPEEA